MDSKKTIKVYPCKTILNHLSDTDTDSIYRLRVGLPYNYEEACSLCERDKPIWQWRYPNRGDLHDNVIRIDYRRGAFWASGDPPAFGRSERGSLFVAIENLGKSHQNIVRLLKAGGRLFERPIMGQDLGKERKEAAHFLYSVNNFVKNNFPEEDLNDLFTRVPFEGSDHNWLGNLYAQRGLHEYALDEIRLAESKEGSPDARIERFSPELLIKEISRKEGEKRSAGKRRSASIKIEALNPRSGKYEALQAKIFRGNGDYVIAPPRLSSDYFDRDGNVRLRFLE